MRYKLLGHSGLRVSELCLGTMTFGEANQLGASEEISRRIFETFVEAGGNFFDTANVYNMGTAERMLADFIGADRDRFVIASKYALCMDQTDPNAGGNHRKNLVQSVDASLKRLGTDYLDLLWVHAWDYSLPVDQIMRALDDLVASGKVLHLGISNASAWIVGSANTLARERGWTPFTAMQILYNLVQRHVEPEYLGLAKTQDMAITPWSPIGGGLLSNKFAKDGDQTARAASRIETTAWGARYKDDQKIAIAEAVNEIADDIGRPTTQVAINWLRQNGTAICVPIIGARTPAQLAENLGCLEFELSAEQIERLNTASAIDHGYPGRLTGDPFMRRLNFGQIGEQIDHPNDPRPVSIE